jgi:MarR family transcriptional regulator, lower aerobic nicotinate degradation pathway regulator
VADESGAHGATARPAGGGLFGYVVENQVGFLLRRAHQRHAVLFQESMGDADLTPMQFTALLKTAEMGRVTQNQLGRLAAMDPATVQGVVRRLIARGLMRRAPDQMDRRTAVLTATEAGLALLAVAVPHARRITAATLAPLDEAERAQLVELLRKIA